MNQSYSARPEKISRNLRLSVEIRGPDSNTVLAADVAPGTSLRVYRDNADWTRAQLSEKTGIPVPHLSGMENDRRPIGKATAKKLAAAFGTDYRRFV